MAFYDSEPGHYNHSELLAAVVETEDTHITGHSELNIDRLNIVKESLAETIRVKLHQVY